MPLDHAHVARFAVLVAMLVLLALYVLLHLPLRTAITALFGGEAHVTTPAVGGVSASLAGIAFLSAATLAAWIVNGALRLARDERVLAFGLLSLALMTVPAAVIGAVAYWQGQVWLRPPVGPLLAAIPALSIVALGIARGWRPRAAFPRMPRVSRLVVVFGGLAAMLNGSAAVVALTHPPSSGDALSYHAPLAVFLWRDGNLGTFLDRAPGTWALAHPGTAELFSGLLLVIGGEGLADLAQLPFAVLGAVAVAVFARRFGLGIGAAALSGCAFLLTPMVALQVGGQANDVTCAALVMAVVALASVPAAQWSWTRLALLGTGLGLIAVTKLALLPAVAAIGLFLMVGALARGNYKRQLARLMVLGLMFGIVVGPWWLRNMAHYGNPLYPSSIPILGRGVFIGDLGRVDTSFVPSARLWPLYPALEAQDDRSGFGALVLVGLIPGLAWAVLRRRRSPMALYALVWAFMLPAWWIVTLHEPRFLLSLIGLGFAFVPLVLLAIPRSLRRLGAVVLAIAAVFSVLVTFDQGIFVAARQPIDRDAFYNHVWTVDPAVADLPEIEGVLHNTGYAPASLPEYAAYYALLGPDLTRTVVPVDWQPSTDAIVARMRAAGVRYAYVLAAPDNRERVLSIYDPRQFDLVHSSSIVPGETNGARRRLYRGAESDELKDATMRYLFVLR